MHTRFEIPDLYCWKHTKSDLGVNPPFICLKAEPKAIEVFLSALDELCRQQLPAEVTLALMPNQYPQACRRIRLIISAQSNELDEMSLTIEDSTACFEFTADGLRKLRTAVTAWHAGEEDFSVHPKKTPQHQAKINRNA